jgi:hypothetical protein
VNFQRIWMLDERYRCRSPDPDGRQPENKYVLFAYF